MGAPNSSSASSVWSRVRAGSVTDVSPSANNPASSTADFTCALAIGISYWMPCNFPPRISSGAKFSSRRVDLRAHFAQWVENALHGTLVQRIVAGNFRGEILSGKNSGKQAHGRAGISGIKRTPTAFQSAQTLAGYANQILFHFYFRTQRFHAAERAVAIRG